MSPPSLHVLIVLPLCQLLAHTAFPVEGADCLPTAEGSHPVCLLVLSRPAMPLSLNFLHISGTEYHFPCLAESEPPAPSWSREVGSTQHKAHEEKRSSPLYLHPQKRGDDHGVSKANNKITSVHPEAVRGIARSQIQIYKPSKHFLLPFTLIFISG